MKKSEQLFTLIEHEDDGILEKALSVKSSRSAVKSWMRFGNIAAVFVGIIAMVSLVVIAFMLGTNQYNPITDPYTDLNGIHGHTQDNGELPPIVYDSSLLGLRIEFPGGWEGNFTVEPIDWPPDSTLEDRGGREGIVIRTTWGGMLMWISRHPANAWDMDSMPPVRHEIILETDDYVFFITWPSDVQWRTSYEEAVFRQMSDEINYIKVSFIGHQTSAGDAEYLEESPLVDRQNPYRIAITIEEVRDIIALQDGTIPLTNVDVAEIRSGEADGIIVLEQCLYEAMEVLLQLYIMNGWPVRNVVAYSLVMPFRPHELPEPERSERFYELPEDMKISTLTSAFFHIAEDMGIISMPPGGWATSDWAWTDEEVELGRYEALRLIALYDGLFPSDESMQKAAQLIYGWRVEVALDSLGTHTPPPSTMNPQAILDGFIPLSDFEQLGFVVEWFPDMSMGMGILRRGELEIIAINMGHGIAVNYNNRSMTFPSVKAPQVVDGILMLPYGLIEEILEALESQ